MTTSEISSVSTTTGTNKPISSAILPNIAPRKPNLYELSYFQLLELVSPELKSKILAAVRLPYEKDEVVMQKLDREVRDFYDNVIRLAEQRSERQGG